MFAFSDQEHVEPLIILPLVFELIWSDIYIHLMFLSNKLISYSSVFGLHPLMVAAGLFVFGGFNQNSLTVK